MNRYGVTFQIKAAQQADRLKYYFINLKPQGKSVRIDECLHQIREQWLRLSYFIYSSRTLIFRICMIPIGVKHQI